MVVDSKEPEEKKTWYVSPENAARINAMVQRSIDKDTFKKRLHGKVVNAARNMAFGWTFIANLPRVLDVDGSIKNAIKEGQVAATSKFDRQEARYIAFYDSARRGVYVESFDIVKDGPNAMYRGLLKLGVTKREAEEVTKRIEIDNGQREPAQIGGSRSPSGT